MTSRIHRAAALVVAVLFMGGLVPLGAGVARADAHATLGDLGYGDTAVKGMFGSASFYVPVPPGDEVAGPVSIDLDFSHSKLLMPDRSTLTVRVNNVDLASTFLTDANADHGHLVVAVPSDIVGEAVFVEARFYLRVTRDECEESSNPALWATVHRTSAIALPTRPRAGLTLAEAPGVLVHASRTEPLRVVIPADAGPVLVRAAGFVAAHAGRWLGAAGRDAVVDTVVDPPAGAPAIVLAPGRDAGGIRAATARHGLLAVERDDAVRLVVSGADDDAVAEAAEALAAIESLRAPAVKLTGAVPLRAPRRSQPWEEAVSSLAQLGVGRLEARGPGTHTHELVVERPAHWRVEGTARVALDIDVAPGARRGPSHVQVSANGFDLGSRRLTPGSGVRRYTFALDGSLLDRDLRGRPKRALRLAVRVHLQPDQPRCTPLDADALRAVVETTSSITLPHSAGSGRELGRFPAGLATPPARIVISDRSPSQVAAAVQMAASIGRWASDASPPVVIAASSLSSGTRNTAPLVLLGDADRELGRRIGIERDPIGVSPSSAVGYVGLVKSPWGNAAALVVHGDGAALLAAARALGSLEQVEGLNGDVAAIVAGEAEVVGRSSPSSPPRALAPTRPRPALRNETVVAAIVLGAFVAAIGLVVRFRWWRART